MKKKIFYIQKENVNIGDKLKLKDRFLKDQSNSKNKIIQLENKISHHIDSNKRLLEKEINSIINNSKLEEKARELRIEKARLKYKEKVYNETKKSLEIIDRLKESSSKHFDDVYTIPNESQKYIITIKDDIFNIYNFYSINVIINNKSTNVISLGWVWFIEDKKIIIEIKSNNIDLSVHTGYDGVEAVNIIYPNVRNPVGLELIVFYDNSI